MKIGIDIIENKRIKLNDNFISKILSENEIEIFKTKTKVEQREFLSGRWAVKEAIIKSLDDPISMNKIDINYIKSKPIILNKELKNISISISHEKKYSVGMAVRVDD
ncbi:holo-ACP synthase [Mycoplasma yeatsii]|uniref:Holo-[acyl-carrier protein] synthase n=1 Tax=Mycoplasma yeatsii TaxID=51365 RepID=A0ABU0NEN7_9MOLU|nr:4'-phosphopantetheinyl transferase superfamily protein [Mycoplasma yeatsii]MDQ0567419.1 holo-[acyl-carrier protein] synthase [Mycoplasma yeatsii]